VAAKKRGDGWPDYAFINTTGAKEFLRIIGKSKTVAALAGGEIRLLPREIKLLI
jgi:hypothetical protein